MFVTISNLIVQQKFPVCKTNMSRRSKVRRRSRSKTRYYSSYNTHIQSHWGRKTWDAIFLLAADYPHDNVCSDDVVVPDEVVRRKRRAWKRMFESLPDVLSCPLCGDHFRAYMERDGGRPFRNALQNRETLFAWLHNCKDEVNKRTKRSSPTLKFVRDMYIAKCSPGKTISKR